MAKKKRKENGRRRPRVGGDPVIPVTFQIIWEEETHAIDPTQPGSYQRNRRGDIVGIYRTRLYATEVDGDWRWNREIKSPRTVFLHVKGVPERRFNSMNKRFREDLTANNTGRMDEPDVIEPPPKVRNRRWRVQIPQLPTPVRNGLRDDKEATMSWDNLRPLTRKKAYIVMEDPLQDNEAEAVQDEDIPED